MLAQRRSRWPSNTSALGQCIVLSGVSGAKMLRRHQHNAAVSKHGTITQCQRLWVNIETALIECHVFAQSIHQTVIDLCWASAVEDWPTLNQQWAAMLAQHWTGIWWVGLHPLYEVHRRQVWNECWPAPVMVVEGIHVEDIFELASLILPLIEWLRVRTC